MKLWARVRCLVFLTHSVEHSPYCLCRPVIDVICTLVRLVHVSGTVVVSGSCSSLVDWLNVNTEILCLSTILNILACLGITFAKSLQGQYSNSFACWSVIPVLPKTLKFPTERISFGNSCFAACCYSSMDLFSGRKFYKTTKSGFSCLMFILLIKIILFYICIYVVNYCVITVVGLACSCVMWMSGMSASEMTYSSHQGYSTHTPV